MDYDISDRIDEILLEKANEGIIGMGVRRKRSGSKSAKKRGSKSAKKRGSKSAKKRGSKSAKKHCSVSKSCKRVVRKAGCMDCECGMGEGVYAGARRRRVSRRIGSKSAKKKHCAVSKSCKRIRRAGGVYAGVKGKSKWITHVKKYWRAHPNLSYKQALVKASASYRR
jgi:hypothetical protein